MSLLTALLAFAPSGLLARAAPEPEPDLKAKLAEAREQLEALRAARDAALHHVLEENARLRRENHMLNVIANATPPVTGLAVPAPIVGAPYQQNQSLAHQAQMLGAQAQMNAQQHWHPCTCVPGRYDALRQDYPRVFDAGHGHGA